MSSCYCHIPNHTMIQAMNSAKLMTGVTLDIGPLAKLDAAARMEEDMEADMSDLFGLEQSVKTIPPSFNAAVSGQLMQLSAAMQLTGGAFNLFDPIKLKEQLTVAADEINRQASAVSMMTGVNLGVIAKFGAVARVKARLALKGLDPEDPGFMDTVNSKAKAYAAIQAHKPQVALGKLPQIHLLAKIPKILEAAAEADIDVLDPPSNTPAIIMARLKPILAIQMPAIRVKVKAILAAAAVIDNVAKIEEEFGELGQSRIRPIAYRIEAMMAMAARIKLPKMAAEIPLPLPEEVRAGERALENPIFKSKFNNFLMPQFNWMPAISAYLALRATLSMKTDTLPPEVCLKCGV